VAGSYETSFPQLELMFLNIYIQYFLTLGLFTFSTSCILRCLVCIVLVVLCVLSLVVLCVLVLVVLCILLLVVLCVLC